MTIKLTIFLEIDTFRIKIGLPCCNKNKSIFLNSKGQEERSQTPLFGENGKWNGHDIWSQLLLKLNIILNKTMYITIWHIFTRWSKYRKLLYTLSQVPRKKTSRYFAKTWYFDDDTEISKGSKLFCHKFHGNISQCSNISLMSKKIKKYW